MARKKMPDPAEQLAILEQELVVLRERQEALYKPWEVLKARNLDARMNALFPNDEITLEGIFQVDWNEIGNMGYGEKWYRKIADQIDLWQHGAWNPKTNQSEGPRPLRGVYRDGINPDTNQVAFKVMMRQHQPVEDQLGLFLILPHVRAFEGWKTFGIFEASLGEFGQSYVLRISEDHKRAEVWKRRDLHYEWGTPLSQKTGEDAIMESMRFIHQQLPYETESSDDLEDSEY